MSFSELNKRKIIVALLLVAGVVYGSLTFFASSSVSGEASVLKHVEPTAVCMVNDEVMEKPQIPVEFEGKTYYGCCQGCVGRIQNDRSVRYSVDPVTGREVDKASAYIMEGPNAQVYYFESAETASQYKASAVGGSGRTN